MPTLELFAERMRVAGLTDDGDLRLDPPLPGLPRVLLRRLSCVLRVPPNPGARQAILDTGAPLSVFPYQVWSGDFRWQAGQHYDELSIAGVGPILRGQALSYRYSCRLARLRVPVELAGTAVGGPRLRLDSAVVQLADPGGPPYIILGLWGSALDGHRLLFERPAGSDDLIARLEF